MKKIMLLAAGLVFSALLILSAAEAAAEVRIAHANLQKALNESDAGIKAKEQLKGEAQKLEEELNVKQEELKKLKDEIDKKGSVWNKETREAKEGDFRAKSQDFQKQFMEYNDRLNGKKQEKEAQIIDELHEIVNDIAKKKGYTYVFERSVSGLLYAPDDADLTDEVIKAHNKKSKGK